MTRNVSLQVAVLVSALFAAGCQQQPDTSAASNETQAAAEQPLPISLNAAMVSLTDQASDYVFAPGNGDMPKNQHDWNLVRQAADDITLAGRVIQIPGTGQYDAQWVAEDDWKRLANEMTAVGREAEKLAEAKSTDQEKWMDVGNRLVQTCLDCHEKFKPETPSQGILHEATKRESEGKSVFD